MILHENNISLRDFRKEDIENKVKWINDSSNNEFLHYDIPLDVEKTINWFENKNNETRKDLVIEYNKIPVGLIGLVSIDKSNSKAEFYISMGEVEFKGKGIATRATKMLLNYAFNEMCLNKVYLNVDEENKIACRLYEKTGFKCEGVFVRDLVHRGKFVNRKRYAILKEEFFTIVGENS